MKCNKDHILKLLDFLYCEVCSAGGDGDAIWYTRYYSILNIFEIVKEYNSSLKFPWDIELGETDIMWGTGEEWIHITTNQDIFDNSPSYFQVKMWH